MLRSFCIAILLVASDAGLSDKIRRAEQPALSGSKQPLTIRLQRVESNGVHLYVGKLFIGQPKPQELNVLFDTASGNVLLPHQACKSKTCSEHKRYSPWRSRTSMDINLDGKQVQEGNRLARGSVTRDAINVDFTQSDLGEGSAQAVIVRDEVCLGDSDAKACADIAVLAATKMDDLPFGKMPNDGIVGLGLTGLSSEATASVFHQLLAETAMSKKDMLPQFGISFGAGSGELFLGGHDESRLGAPLQWFPVLHPEDGFWEVEIKVVRLGDTVVDACKQGCRGIVDTGASLLGVQDKNYESVRSALAGAVSPGAKGGCTGANLEFDLGGMALTFRPEDFTGVACAPQVGSLNLTDVEESKNVYAFGETMLRRYYTAFDWKERRIGFAPAASRRVRLGGKAKADSSPEKVFVV